MQAVQVVATGQAVFVETPKPTLKPGHVLVRVERVSLCGSDIHTLYYARPEQYPFPPGAAGHEMVGTVEAIDAPGSPIKPGDRALVLSFLAMAEYALVPVEHVLPLPPGKPVEHLLQAQQLGTVIYAAKRMPNLLDKDVVVVGQGSAGLWWNFLVRRLGARRVIGIDLQSHRLALAEYYGATHTVHSATVDPIQAVSELTQGRMADVVVEAAGEPASINLTVELVKHFGFIFFFGVPRTRSLQFPMDRFFGKCLQAQAVVGAMSDPDQSCTRMALELIAGGIADPGPMITHHFPFSQVLEAYELQYTHDEGSVKIVVDVAD
jgi:threonine dehydrogenase-like Zn-dependent dehydrogenase